MTGRLLVATPGMNDPNFDRSVVLVLEHGEEGALGVVLTRPSAFEVGEALPEWRHGLTDPPVVFVGGPVAPGSAIALAEADLAPSDGFRPIDGALGTLDLSQSPDEVGGIGRLRVFTGYAGWSAGQLETELEAGSWLVTDRLEDDPFSSDPEHLWTGVLRRPAGALDAMALHPPQPWCN